MVNSVPRPTWLSTAIRPPSRRESSVTDGQPQLRALARGFGGEKRVGDLAQVSFRDAAPRIADDDIHPLIMAQPGPRQR